jgi:oxygen-independent coproporphyrinogen-3 oxidase
MDGVRFGQSRDLDGFLAGKDITDFTQVLTPADREAEFIMLALRLSDGIEEEGFLRRFGKDFWHTYGDICISYVERGLMEWEHGRVRLTEAGFSVSNAILTELLADLL